MRLNSRVCGVGIMDGPTLRNRSTYYAWKSMLRRCYSKPERTYVGCTVCSDWLRFSNFYKWYVRNYAEGYQIDKDILKSGNKVYCPNYCRFVPQEINLLLNKNEAMRGACKQGVSKTATGRYQATLSKHGKNISLGAFKSERKAYRVYMKCKASWIREVARKYFLAGAIDESIFSALVHRSYLRDF